MSFFKLYRDNEKENVTALDEPRELVRKEIIPAFSRGVHNDNVGPFLLQRRKYISFWTGI